MHIGRAARASAAASSKIALLLVSVVKLQCRFDDARREILKRAALLAGASNSAPLELTSLVTFLFSDKKVTHPNNDTFLIIQENKMKRVTIRVPATTANLGPGFDAFGCALGLYTDVTFEETDFGLEITGCPEEFTGPDNLVYVSYCAVLNTMSEEVRGVKIHIDAHIPICRGLGSSAALLVAGAMGANVLRGNKLSTQGLLNITNAMAGHPDNLAPAFYGGLTASLVHNRLPVPVPFPLPPDR